MEDKGIKEWRKRGEVKCREAFVDLRALVSIFPFKMKIKFSNATKSKRIVLVAIALLELK